MKKIVLLGILFCMVTASYAVPVISKHIKIKLASDSVIPYEWLEEVDRAPEDYEDFCNQMPMQPLPKWKQAIQYIGDKILGSYLTVKETFIVGYYQSKRMIAKYLTMLGLYKYKNNNPSIHLAIARHFQPSHKASADSAGRTQER